MEKNFTENLTCGIEIFKNLFEFFEKFQKYVIIILRYFKILEIFDNLKFLNLLDFKNESWSI